MKTYKRSQTNTSKFFQTKQLSGGDQTIKRSWGFELINGNFLNSAIAINSAQSIRCPENSICGKSTGEYSSQKKLLLSLIFQHLWRNIFYNELESDLQCRKIYTEKCKIRKKCILEVFTQVLFTLPVGILEKCKTAIITQEK